MFFLALLLGFAFPFALCAKGNANYQSLKNIGKCNNEKYRRSLSLPTLCYLRLNLPCDLYPLDKVQRAEKKGSKQGAKRAQRQSQQRRVRHFLWFISNFIQNYL